MEAHDEDGRDVTIYLMPNATTDSQGSASPTRKRKRIAEDMEGPQGGNGLATPLCEIHANSTTLRQCSKYFESCISGRRTQSGQSSSAMKFHLEVQTEERYYHDCFSRMSIFLHPPIGNVKECLGLLKVASQIEYKELMDRCVQCLSAIPWSSEEEEQIRNFCLSGQCFDLFCGQAAIDLTARIHLATREKQEQLGTCVMKTLSRYLDAALESNDKTLPCKREESRAVFANAFHAIVTESASGSKFHNGLIHNILPLAKEQSERLLRFVSKSSGKSSDPRKTRYVRFGYFLTEILDGISSFWWLFQILQKAHNAAEGVVEVLVKDEAISEGLLQTGLTIYSNTYDLSNWLQVQTILIKMITAVLDDIMSGRLFLKSSDRMTLFLQWNWIVRDVSSKGRGRDGIAVDRFRELMSCAKRVFTSFFMTFPLQHQEEIDCLLMERRVEHAYYSQVEPDLRVISEDQSTWIMKLITQDLSSGHELKNLGPHHEGQWNPADKGKVIPAEDVGIGLSSLSTQSDPEVAGSSSRGVVTAVLPTNDNAITKAECCRCT